MEKHMKLIGKINQLLLKTKKWNKWKFKIAKKYKKLKLFKNQQNIKLSLLDQNEN